MRKWTRRRARIQSDLLQRLGRRLATQPEHQEQTAEYSSGAVMVRSLPVEAHLFRMRAPVRLLRRAPELSDFVAIISFAHVAELGDVIGNCIALASRHLIIVQNMLDAADRIVQLALVEMVV